MVKKIQIVQEETTPEQMDQADFQKKLLDLLAAMDWKLWELYKIEQERTKLWEQYESERKSSNLTAHDNTDSSTDETDTNFNPIRIDED